MEAAGPRGATPVAADGVGTSATTGTAARDRVFEEVLSRGPVTASAVAQALDVTPAAVRRHLEALELDGLVAVRDATTAGPRPRGRPARAYVVTAHGQRAARPGYEDAALSVLDHLARVYGPDAVARYADERMSAMESRWRPVVEAAGPDPLDRARALAAALTADGFAAAARAVAPPPATPHAADPTVTPGREAPADGGNTSPVRGVQLCQGHCPVHALAERYPDLCEAETRSFSRLVGRHVQRLATIAHGDHACTTFVPDTGEPTPAGPTRAGSAIMIRQSDPSGGDAA